MGMRNDMDTAVGYAGGTLRAPSASTQRVHVTRARGGALFIEQAAPWVRHASCCYGPGDLLHLPREWGAPAPCERATSPTMLPAPQCYQPHNATSKLHQRVKCWHRHPEIYTARTCRLNRLHPRHGKAVLEARLDHAIRWRRAYGGSRLPGSAHAAAIAVLRHCRMHSLALNLPCNASPERPPGVPWLCTLLPDTTAEVPSEEDMGQAVAHEGTGGERPANTRCKGIRWWYHMCPDLYSIPAKQLRAVRCCHRTAVCFCHGLEPECLGKVGLDWIASCVLQIITRTPVRFHLPSSYLLRSSPHCKCGAGSSASCFAE